MIIAFEESADTEAHDADSAKKDKIVTRQKRKAEGHGKIIGDQKESQLVQVKITVKVSVEKAAMQCSIYHKELSLTIN